MVAPNPYITDFLRYCTDIATPSCGGDSTERREIPKPRCETDGGMEFTIVKEVSEGRDRRGLVTTTGGGGWSCLRRQMALSLEICFKDNCGPGGGGERD